MTSLHTNILPVPGYTNNHHEVVTHHPDEGKLENYFAAFRNNIIGQKQKFESPLGRKQVLYADWTASGRAYRPIEEYLQNEIMPFVANTHTQATVTGTLMTKAYETAKSIVKEHVHANSDDVLIFCGSGMTGAINKLQRILGLKIPERIMEYVHVRRSQDRIIPMNAATHKDGLNNHLQLDELRRPVVFITHMEHHSNQVSWLETIATVEIIRPGANGNVDLQHFRDLLHQYRHRKNKIAAITACSNVTGIQTPYYEMAKIIHEQGGVCFVDFSCSAPYVDINMHPVEKDQYLDAIFFSPHKFLGGPGTPGVLIFNKKVNKNIVPDQPGGGTVSYSNPWKVHEYVEDIEQREDGGTPPFLQGIKAAMCIRLKERMGVDNILKREEEILQIIFKRFSAIKNVEVLAGNIKKRLGVISFLVHGAHYDLIVKILNDRFGVQARGGCSCAGTYGHLLLGVDEKKSVEILKKIRSGDLSGKPGWIRLSVHPTMTNAEIRLIMDAIECTASNFQIWGNDYTYDTQSNGYSFKGAQPYEARKITDWFNASGWERAANFNQ